MEPDIRLEYLGGGAPGAQGVQEPNMLGSSRKTGNMLRALWACLSWDARRRHRRLPGCLEVGRPGTEGRPKARHRWNKVCRESKEDQEAAGDMC